MSKVLFKHPISGHVRIAINGVTHTAQLMNDEPFADALRLAVSRGNSPAEALRSLAVIGVHVWHPGRTPGIDLLRQWERFFGDPGQLPNGSILGNAVVHMVNQKFDAEIRGGDFYDTQLLRAHARGEDAALAFKFLAEVGVRLHKSNNIMLGSQQQSELRRLFGF